MLTDDAEGPLVALVGPTVVGDDVVHEPRTPYADARPGRNLAGKPRDGLTLHRLYASAARVTPADVTDALRRLDLTLAALIAGAAQRACDLVVAHLAEREQFGRPLAAFQAVKQELARLVEEVAVVSAAVDLAVDGMTSGHDPDLAVAIAAVQAEASITEITRIAHQLHGAVGFTELSPLRHATLRLWSWRDEWTAIWDRWLGEATREARWDGPWPMLTAGAEQHRSLHRDRAAHHRPLTPASASCGVGDSIRDTLSRLGYPGDLRTGSSSCWRSYS